MLAKSNDGTGGQIICIPDAPDNVVKELQLLCRTKEAA
jgi:hypothetical protein